MRLTKKYQNDYGFTKPCDDLEHLQLVADKLGQLEDLMEKYEINTIEDLEKILADYDDMALAVVKMGLKLL